MSKKIKKSQSVFVCVLWAWLCCLSTLSLPSSRLFTAHLVSRVNWLQFYLYFSYFPLHYNLNIKHLLSSFHHFSYHIVCVCVRARGTLASLPPSSLHASDIPALTQAVNTTLFLIVCINIYYFIIILLLYQFPCHYSSIYLSLKIVECNLVLGKFFTLGMD